MSNVFYNLHDIFHKVLYNIAVLSRCNTLAHLRLPTLAFIASSFKDFFSHNYVLIQMLKYRFTPIYLAEKADLMILNQNIGYEY